MDLNSYISLFPGASREKPRFMALAEAVLTQVADLFPLIAQLQSGFSFALAEGKQLDQIASAIGLSRKDIGIEDMPDEEFRQHILGKLALWRWDGTNAGVARACEEAGITKTLTDQMDGTVEISQEGDVPPGGCFPIPVAVSIVMPEAPEEEEEPE